MSTILNSCYRRVEACLSIGFEKYGRLVARNPWIFVIGSVIVSGCLGIGVVRMATEDDVEKVYTPKNSQAKKDRNYIYRTYPELSVSNFSSRTLPDPGLWADVIMKASEDGADILNSRNLDEVRRVYESVTNFTVQHGVTTLSYNDVCARKNSGCAVRGAFVFTSLFKDDLNRSVVDYPFYESAAFGSVFLPNVFGDVYLNHDKLSSSKYLRLRFNLRQDSRYKEVTDWMQSFLRHIENVSSDLLDIAYVHSESLAEEVNRNATGDTVYYLLTIMVMIAYAIAAISGGNCVSNRGILANAGILSTSLSILGSLGLMAALGVKYVSITAVTPFLLFVINQSEGQMVTLQAIGVDGMFILLSGLSNVQHLDTVEERISEMMKTAGFAITITSVTDLLAFCVGSFSVFMCVQNFCLYTGVGVIFCYFNLVTFFIGCMTLHERRVLDSRHGITCMVTKSKEEMLASGVSPLKILCCSGSKPKSRDEVEGLLERYPRKFVSYILQSPVIRIVILLLFVGYLGFAIYGVTRIEEGLALQQCVSDTSYYRKYDAFLQHLTYDHYVSLVFKDNVDYWNVSVRNEIEGLITSAQSIPTIRPNFSQSWIRDFSSSPMFNDSSKASFVNAVQKFLDASTLHVNDVVIKNNTIISSRVYLMTQNILSSTAQGDLMLDTREAVRNITLPAFAYAPAFVYYEQYTVVLRCTIQTISIAFVAVIVATFVFMPHLVMIIFAIITMVMILLGVFGFMYYWGLTLSSMTMMMLIMSVGFAIDYSLHTCHAFIQSDKKTRFDKMNVAVNLAAAPILNAALSSFAGILVVSFSKSYLFRTFFKVMLSVVVLGFVHSTLFLPSLLSFVGPIELTSPATISPSESAETSPLKNSVLYADDSLMDKLTESTPANYHSTGTFACRSPFERV